MTPIQRSETHPTSSHSNLDLEIAQWRAWWEELAEMGDPHFGEMASRLAQFRTHLAEHFDSEESGAFLTVVVDADPAVTEKIARLQEEHRTFLVDLDGLIERLQSCQPGLDCWGQARTQFEDFLDRLHSHEEAEDELKLQ